ncbi:aldo-keto reductase family 1 member C1-like [Dasypus novemcinctus]|uniref:aldo-keto reductase family 1 member C1-like n=1 Tax=Dasypus novemcinctus TaxID=9361 RepID=UPI0039C9342C
MAREILKCLKRFVGLIAGILGLIGVIAAAAIATVALHGMALEKCKDAGLTKSIGVSNFNHKQLKRTLNKSGLKYKPVCNQVECHPYLNQRKLLDYCKSKDIVLVAYSALGSHRHEKWVDQNSPVLLDYPVLCNIAKKHKRTPALTALHYQIQREVVVLAKSLNEKQSEENFQHDAPLLPRVFHPLANQPRLHFMMVARIQETE